MKGYFMPQGLTEQQRQQVEQNFQRLRDAYDRNAGGSIETQTILAQQKSNGYADASLKQKQFNEIAGRYGFQVRNIDPNEAVGPGRADDQVVPRRR